MLKVAFWLFGVSGSPIKDSLSTLYMPKLPFETSQYGVVGSWFESIFRASLNS